MLLLFLLSMLLLLGVHKEEQHGPHKEEQNGPHQDEQQGPHQEEFCVFLMFCYWFKCYTNPVTDHIMPFEGCKLVIFTRFEFCI
jgi:hypothetical protein